MFIDELVNLKLQLSQTYTLHEPAKKNKIVSVVKPVDQDVLHLKQQFPDLMDISCVENMMHLLDKPENRCKKITMSEADDFSNTTLIPLDYDYTLDMFGGEGTDSLFLMPQIDDYTLALGEISGPPGVTSTVRKPDAVSRAPFGNLTNIEKVRNEQSIQEFPDFGTLLAPGEETRANQFFTTGKILLTGM